MHKKAKAFHRTATQPNHPERLQRHLGLRLLMVFETAQGAIEGRSPGLTPTQVWRTEVAKKAFELTCAVSFQTSQDLKAGLQKACLPNLTPTQVWRPERRKQASEAMKKLKKKTIGFHCVSLTRSGDAKIITCVTFGGPRWFWVDKRSSVRTKSIQPQTIWAYVC